MDKVATTGSVFDGGQHVDEEGKNDIRQFEAVGGTIKSLMEEVKNL